jgi:hypothetical protein
MAQARHAAPAVIGDPGIDKTLGYVKRRGGFGAGPTIDEYSLDDPAALRRGQADPFARTIFHASPTCEHAQNSRRFRL